VVAETSPAAAVALETAPAPAPAAAVPAGSVPADPAAVPASTAPPTDAAPAPVPAPSVAVPAGPGATDLSALEGLTVVTVPTPGAPSAPAAPAADSVLPLTVGEAGTPLPVTAPEGQDSAASGNADDAPAPPAAAAPTDAPDVPTPSVAPPAASTAPVPAAAPDTASAAAQPVATQVARQVAVLRGAPDGSHTMTLVLTPETLGPVEVSVTVSSGALDLTLRSANEHGRAALLDALPDLRRDLEQAGLTVTRAEVGRDSTGSRFADQSTAWADRQQAFGDRGSQGRGGDRSRPWLGAADTGTVGTTPAPVRTTSTGVDVRV
jgi:hypothetical protein